MIQTIKQLAREAVSAASPLEFVEAIVIEAPPELKIKLKNNSKLIIPKELLIVSEHLTRHDRIVSLNYEYPKTWEKDPDIGDMPKETVSSRNNIGQSPSTPYEKYEMKYAKMTFGDLLKIDDEIMVAVIQGGQFFYVLDRTIKYE